MSSRDALALVAIAIAIAGLAITTYPTKARLEEARKERQATLEVARADMVDQIIDSIIYLKDPRTAQCFAFSWSRTDEFHQVKAFATVPCDAIPPNLLRTARIAADPK